MISKREIIALAAKHLNREIENRQGPANSQKKNRSAAPYFTIPAPDAGITIRFHGFFTRYLTKKSQEILDFKNNPGTDVRLHNHDYFELIFLLQGSTTHHMPGQTLQQMPDSLILMNSYAVHGPVPDSEDTVMFNFCIKREIFASIFSSMPSFNQTFSHFLLDSLHSEGRKKRFLRLPLTPAARDILQKMLWEYYQDTLCGQQKLYALLILLFSHITRQQFVDANQALTGNAPVADILEKIRVNYTAITLEKLSSLSGYSPWHLSRLVKKHTGKTFQSYVTACRMEHAASYVARSHFSFEKICELVGYANTSYFYQKFREYYGCTPAQYREQHRTPENNDDQKS